MNPDRPGPGLEVVEGTSPSVEAEFSIEEVARHLKEAEAVRAQRIEQDIATQEQLIAKAKQLDAVLKQGQEQVDYFQTKFDLDPHRDQREIELLEKLKTDVGATQQALLETNSQIDKISSKPEVMSRVQDEAEKVQEAKEKYQEILASIDKIKDLLEQDEASRTESAHLSNEASAKNSAMWRFVNDARNRTGNTDLRRALDELHGRGWEQVIKERLTTIRTALGMFKGRDKAIIDEVSEKFPGFKQEFDSASSEMNRLWAQAREARAEAERIRTQISMYYYEIWGKEEMEKSRRELEDTYEKKIGKSLLDRVD